MAKLNQTYNINDLPDDESSGDFMSLPAGDYHVRITQADIQPTRAGDGQLIKLRLDVLGPTYQGRVLFKHINIQNRNADAERIGRKELRSIMTALGLTQLTDTDQLINRQMLVKVKVIKSKNPEYGDANGNENTVSGYGAITGSVVPAPAFAAPKPPAAPVTPAPGKAPWER
jgi:hypothetical protein